MTVHECCVCVVLCAVCVGGNGVGWKNERDCNDGREMKSVGS